MVVILILSNIPLLKAFAASKNERSEYLNCADAPGVEAESGDAADTAKNDDLPELDGKIDEIISSFSEEDFKFLLDELNEITGKERTLKETITAFITGESGLSYATLKTYFLSRTFSLASANYDALIYLACLIALLAFSNIIIAKNNDNSEKSIVFYIYYPLIACLVLSLVKSAFKYAEAALSAQTKLTELLFPIMFSVTLIAGDFGVALIKPFTVFLGFFTGELILDFFLPLLSLAFCVLVVGNLSDKLNLNELFKTLMSVFKWSIGFIAAIYSSLITVEGLCNGTYNGVSVKILKYLSGTSVPIVGGLISGSTDVILSAVTLVKNSIGVMSAVVIICYVGLKGVNSVAYSLSLKFLNSLLAPVTNSRITKLINGSCEIISALAALIFLSGLMFILTVVFVIKSTGGLF